MPYLPQLIFLNRFNLKTGTRTITIRADTEYEELIGIKREWVHPYRHLYKNSLYYDIAILELGKNNM